MHFNLSQGSNDSLFRCNVVVVYLVKHVSFLEACPLGSYCPLATINKTTGVCEP